MSHVNAPLAPRGRAILIQRVVFDGRPVAHVAKEMGISRQCAHRWVRRFRDEGHAGLQDRSSRPNSSPSKTSPEREAAVLEARAKYRAGPARLARETGVPARTVSRILNRHHVPPLAWLDPITGVPIRATRATANRYERDHPGEQIDLDVKKVGRIPAGGGWRADPTQTARNHSPSRQRLGYDYVHAAVDDHSRLAYAEVLPDERGETAAGFLTRAASYFADHGIDCIQRVLTDNALCYRRSVAFKTAVADLGAKQQFIKPHCPWTNGKVERFNRTLATEWAYARAYGSNTEREAALAAWVTYYNTERIHSSHGTTPAARVSPT